MAVTCAPNVDGNDILPSETQNFVKAEIKSYLSSGGRRNDSDVAVFNAGLPLLLLHRSEPSADCSTYALCWSHYVLRFYFGLLPGKLRRR